MFALRELVVAARGDVQEGVVLLLTLTDVRGHEVLLRAEEHLVPRALNVGMHGLPVRSRVIADCGVHGVPSVRKRRILGILVAHLRAHLGPDAVGTHEHVPFERLAGGQRGAYFISHVFVLLHHGFHHDVLFAHRVAEDVEEVVARDDECQRQAVVVARLARVEPVEPVAE